MDGPPSQREEQRADAAATTCRLLFVDDDESYLELLRQSLARLRPRWFLDPQLATPDWLAEWSERIGDRITDYDVVILDYELCDHEAPELIAPLHEHYDWCPPIAILSGTLTDERIRACTEQGARCCAAKPYRLADARDLVEQLESIAAEKPAPDQPMRQDPGPAA